MTQRMDLPAQEPAIVVERCPYCHKPFDAAPDARVNRATLSAHLASRPDWCLQAERTAYDRDLEEIFGLTRAAIEKALKGKWTVDEVVGKLAEFPLRPGDRIITATVSRKREGLTGFALIEEGGDGG